MLDWIVDEGWLSEYPPEYNYSIVARMVPLAAKSGFVASLPWIAPQAALFGLHSYGLRQAYRKLEASRPCYWIHSGHPCWNDGVLPKMRNAGLQPDGCVTAESKVIFKKEHTIQRPSWGLALPEGTPSPCLARIFAEELFMIFMHNSFRCWWIHYWKSPK